MEHASTMEAAKFLITVGNLTKLQKLKGILRVASRGKWQLYYETPDKLHQYYSPTQWKLYGNYSNPLESFMSTVSCRTFSELFLPYTGHCIIGQYFQMRRISERDFLRNVSLKLDSRIFLDTKRGPWSGGQLLRCITAVYLLIGRLIRPVC